LHHHLWLCTRKKGVFRSIEDFNSYNTPIGGIVDGDILRKAVCSNFKRFFEKENI
jgi:hypothetical protein